MKKSISILLSFILLLTLFSTVAFAKEGDFPGTLKYTDWQMNDDYTKITINGKTYDNYIFILRIGDEVRVYNPAYQFLFMPVMQDITPEQYFSKELKKSAFGVLRGIEAQYPFGELLYINNEPWQDTEFKDYFIEKFKRCRRDDENIDEKISFLNNKENNGYAQKVLYEKKDIAQAKKEWNIKEVKIVSDNAQLYRNHQEFAKDGGWKNADQEINLLTYQEYIDGKLLKDVNEEKPLDNNETTVTLYLNNKNINVTQNGASNNIALDVTPYCPVGTTLVPLRGVFEAFNADVKWLPDTRQVEVTKGEMNMLLTIGSKTALVNGKKATLLEAPRILNGRTIIPLRFISENLGYDVKWFGTEKKIVISN
ncbi:MAG: stalk domain-containing protein [Anaerovoracaceae bacterium]|jgi:hypothetical protein